MGGFMATVDELFNTVTRLTTSELEQFIPRVLYERAKRQAPSLSHTETQLLKNINRGLSIKAQSRYNQLTQKQQERTLTPTEQEELFRLIDQIEVADAKRVGYLAQLAELRGISLDAVMLQLGIRPRPYA